jgi:hypothetical protein
MRSSLLMARARWNRRALRRAAGGATVLALATGCISPPEAPVDDHTFAIHQVITFATAGIPITDITHRQVLEAYGWELSESALAAAKWFLASNCRDPAPATEEFTVACDSSSTTTYILQPATITAQDVASAELITADAARERGFREGDLSLTFTPEGAAVFGPLTAALANAIPPANQMAIVIDGVVVADPVVAQEIPGDSVVVAGTGSDMDWHDIAAWLNGRP